MLHRFCKRLGDNSPIEAPCEWILHGGVAKKWAKTPPAVGQAHLWTGRGISGLFRTFYVHKPLGNTIGGTRIVKEVRLYGLYRGGMSFRSTPNSTHVRSKNFGAGARHYGSESESGRKSGGPLKKFLKRLLVVFPVTYWLYAHGHLPVIHLKHIDEDTFDSLDNMVVVLLHSPFWYPKELVKKLEGALPKGVKMYYTLK
ncbi:hypothetical protein BEWA_050440 [Theileria equi strain WA]|uniref:Uncharacterized protein n=1 Tax=Theileria equi strain WA TaxID=1537102 RepID=L1LB70_THEEQ|nr:hypothetical protein BEWA_050440 [Theileria equi strain WA]EKX72576.1 hypothetical protein BEWA_050440 [Theileria equi strain WA]|eukprot:XP_004832028.1 hypothetical protein BEWA_050440 [Theileria equi strain WA]